MSFSREEILSLVKLPNTLGAISDTIKKSSDQLITYQDKKYQFKIARREDQYGKYYQIIYPIEYNHSTVWISDIVLRPKLFNQNDFFIEKHPLKKIIEKNNNYALKYFHLDNILQDDTIEELKDAYQIMSNLEENKNLFAKLKHLANKTHEKLQKTSLLAEQKKIILRAIRLIPFKKFAEPMSGEDIFLTDKKEVILYYFFQELKEPLLYNCLDENAVKNVFRSIHQEQELATSSLKKTLQSAESDTKIHLKNNNETIYNWKVAIKHDLHFAFLNEQAKTQTLNQQASLAMRLTNAQNRYANHLEEIDSVSPSKLPAYSTATYIANQIGEIYHITKKPLQEKHVSANHFYHFLKDNKLNNDFIHQALSLEKEAAAQAREQFKIFGNKKSRFETIIEENLTVNSQAFNKVDLFNNSLISLLKKTYEIERSPSYKMKRVFNASKYKTEQECIHSIRTIVYAFIKEENNNKNFITEVLNQYKNQIDFIENTHPSLKKIFTNITETKDAFENPKEFLFQNF